MITALAIIFVFGLMVIIHELGHFLVAKKTGVKVLEFAFGIGPKLVGVQGRETLYSIRILPLGGFVRFLSAEEIEEKDGMKSQELQDKSFESKNLRQKASIIAAGPIMNFLLGAVLFIIVFTWFGIPTVSNENVIGGLTPDMPAVNAGLEIGDRILAVNGVSTPDWDAVTKQIHSSPSQQILLQIQKAETREILDMKITPEFDPQHEIGLIGITPPVFYKKVSVLESAQYGLKQTFEFTRLVLSYLIQMITGQMAVELGGPIAVAQVIGEGAKQGLSNLLSLTGILSIQFGILNLLPIPALDGGQLAVLTYEGIRRKPVSPEKKGLIQLTGFALLIALMIAVTYKDILRILAK